MPARLRQAAAVPLETASAEKRYNIPGLEYHEPLSWRAGKAIPVSDLLDRLQRLGNELRSYEEDQIDRPAFVRLAQDLANANLLGHKDKGIRAWTLCCVVDLLQICAPDAPFSNAQLKDIFTVIITSILPALGDPSNAYNSEHYHVLTSLTEFKSIILITDLEHADSLILPLFSTCFDIVSGSAKHAGDVEVSKSVEYHLNNLLAIVIDEVTLPQDVTDIIISQFLRVDPRSPFEQHSGRSKKLVESQDGKQSNLLLKDYPPAYNMAKSICTSCTEKMTAQISQYFNNVIVDASSTIKQTNGNTKHGGRRVSDVDMNEDDTDDLADLTKAHRLIRELWRVCPDLLINVIPQLEAELSSDKVALRLLATETLGDITAGVGIAGLPAVNTLDPAAYPLPSINSPESVPSNVNPIQAPLSPKPFATLHAAAYNSFLGRRYDRSPAVRAVWATAVSRILLTSAGGIGMSDAEQEILLRGLAQMLGDADEKVRLTSITSLSAFNYRAVINCLGALGGIANEGSVFAMVAERCKDRKQVVRDEAIKILARLWGVASYDIENGNDKVIATLGEVPTRLFSTYFLNDLEIHAMLDKVLQESLLPISFPPVKVQISRTESQKQRAKDKEDGSQEAPTIDPDTIRVRRMLTLVRSLDAKTKLVFFSLQYRQVQLTKAMTAVLRSCEEYNGGVIEENEEAVKAALTKYIEATARMFPDPQKVTADMWKFAKMHDRRNYQLIRFAMGPQHDYRTVTKAMKELAKRIQTGPTSAQGIMETLTPLMYRISLLVYNRSHVPPIMQISRSDENGLAEAAHEVLKEISARNPEVLKTHIRDLCKELEANAPSASKAEDASAADTLKACAAFARKYPSEVSKERKFLNALTSYALYSSSPRAAKHSVSIVLIVAEKKEMYAKDILQKALQNCNYRLSNFTSRLATIAQVCLLAPAAANVETDAILEIAVEDVLFKNQHSTDSSATWSDIADAESVAKELALKVMVNRCRSEDEKANPVEFEKLTKPLYTLLMRCINDDGEVTPTKNTPPAQRSRLKLAAARYILKLCNHKRRCEDLVTPSMFVKISSIVLNPPNEVRVGFVNQVKKYIGQNRLNYRWFTVLFLIAFEPDEDLKSSTVTWLKSRVLFHARQQQQIKEGKKVHQNVMEGLFARLLSLLAHHPDYPEQDGDDQGGYDEDLLDFSKYICFYLSAVATEDNLSLIFHVAQRVKQTQDVVTGTEQMSQRLYVLSDLAQAVIRNWADVMEEKKRGSVTLLQTWPGKVGLPTSLFAALPSHEISQEIVDKNYLPEDVASGLEKLVRAYFKASKGGHHTGKKVAIGGDKKRRSGESVDLDDENSNGRLVKKQKRTTTLPVRKASGIAKTPKPKRKSSDLSSSELPSRKSSRVASTTSKSYIERDSSEDEMEMEEIDKMASSPMTNRAKQVQSLSPEVEEVSDVPEEVNLGQEQTNGDEKMQEVDGMDGTDDKENEQADVDDEEGETEDEEARDTTPSPLKEKSQGNVGGKKSSGKKGVGSKKANARGRTTPPDAQTRAGGRVTRSRG